MPTGDDVVAVIVFALSDVDWPPNIVADVDVESIIVEAKGQLPTESGLSEEVDESPMDLVVSSTPLEAPATKKKMTILSDNKENIGSASKVSLTKERVKMATTKKPAEDLESYSMRKLTMMLKTKLQIANQSLKNEKDNEVNMNECLLIRILC